MATYLLGISAFYHDSAAALLADDKIIAAAQEERFTRKKNDPGFPAHAIRYVLEEAGIDYTEISAIAFYDKPLLKFERLLQTYHAFAPLGVRSFAKAMPAWMKEKLLLRSFLRKQLRSFGRQHPPLLFPEHHLSHAASAYYPSPFEEAAVLTIDGVGEWATTAICHASPDELKVLKELRFPHSVGLLYSAFTYYLGFKVNSGEYKLMGLAAYGNSDGMETMTFKEKICNELVDIREDGSILLNMHYFDFATGSVMTKNRKWEKLFGLSRRLPESEIRQQHKDLALAIQQVTESIVLSLARTAQQLTGSKHLVMAGGVALNCVANSRIAEAGLFEKIWIQPAAGDAGGALGAAYAAWHIGYGQGKLPNEGRDRMGGAFLGPGYTDGEIGQVIRRQKVGYRYFNDFRQLAMLVSQKLAEGQVVGWFQDRMEFGPRALGNRSILADPRNPAMQQRLNEKIKFREEFRPFAPAVLEEDLTLYFTTNEVSPYMLRVAEVQEAQRSGLPAITHVDASARIQTVNWEGQPKFWMLINEFKKLTGCSLLINTSFNVRGEPIVCSPEDAWQGFVRTGMDCLVMGNYFIEKAPR